MFLGLIRISDSNLNSHFQKLISFICNVSYYYFGQLLLEGLKLIKPNPRKMDFRYT